MAQSRSEPQSVDSELSPFAFRAFGTRSTIADTLVRSAAVRTERRRVEAGAGAGATARRLGDAHGRGGGAVGKYQRRRSATTGVRRLRVLFTVRCSRRRAAVCEALGRVDVRPCAMRLPRDRTGALAYPKVEAAERAPAGRRWRYGDAARAGQGLRGSQGPKAKAAQGSKA